MSFLFLTLRRYIRGGQLSGLSSRLAHSASWALVGAVVGRGISMLSYIWVARLLTQAVYGEFGILRSTINMFTVFAGMGLGATASKYIAQYRNTDATKAGDIYTLSNILIFFIAAVFSALLFFFSSYIANYSLHAPDLSDEIKIGAIVLFFITVNSVQNGALAGFEDFKSIAVNTFVSCCIQATLLIAGCYWKGIYGMLIGWGVGCFSCYLLNRRSIRIQLIKYKISTAVHHIRKTDLMVLWRFSLPALLASIMVGPVLWWTKTFLVSHSNYEEMAIFDVAEQWYTMVLFVPSTLAQIILPMLTNVLEEGSPRQYLKLIKFNLSINILISLILSVLMVLIGPYVMGIYGKGFVDTHTLTLMMAATVASSACNVVGQVIASRDKMWHGFGFNFVWAVWIILFTFLFVGYYDMGAKGLALAIFLGYLSHFILQAIYIKKTINASWKNEKNNASIRNSSRSY